eukprot:Blabericola_migrator_1__6484@NODE_3272_length_1891_cov_315_559211_g1917_i1_p1_GENE_NODE_3272_length_1891_cov_315_559211_g1917_i1NODE_3272_length_1891_cov_315_559211_g1917_i1_p1_ORF_typecomplete_len288_score56_30Aldo_ket_red/PF00248_21/1_8e13_NODE_3272_length_1891_cov_315_559211_g1917_i19841847
MKVLCTRLHNGTLMPGIAAMYSHATLAGMRHVICEGPVTMWDEPAELIEDKESLVAAGFVFVDEVEYKGAFRIPHPDVVQPPSLFVTLILPQSVYQDPSTLIFSWLKDNLAVQKRHCGDLLLLPPSTPACFEDMMVAWKIVEQIYMDKQIRAAGVSNWSYSDLTALVADVKVRRLTGDVNAIMPMVDCINLTRDIEPVVEYCAIENIAILAKIPVNPEVWSHDERVIQLSKSKGVSPGAIMLRWALERNYNVIPEGSDQDVIDSIKCLHISLSTEDENDINYFGLVN